MLPIFRLLILAMSFVRSPAQNSSFVFVSSWKALWDAVDQQASGTALYAFLDSSNSAFNFDYSDEKGLIVVGPG